MAITGKRTDTPNWLVALVLALAVGVSFDARAAADASKPIGGAVSNVRSLRDVRGHRRPLHSFANHSPVVLVFMSIDCPVAALYTPGLVALEKQLRPKGVQFAAVFPNDRETLDRVAAYASDREIPFPVLKDFGQKLADELGVDRVPTVVVLDAGFCVRYRGAIDDQYGVGVRKPAPTRKHLEAAIDALLAGKEVAAVETTTDGCPVERAPAVEPRKDTTYNKDVAAILQRRCQACHRPGQVGPFSLLSYDDAASHAAALREAVVERRMPPWHADSRFGQFSNDRSLSQAEIDALVGWVDAGMPRGNDAAAPPPAVWPDGWRIGTPDVVLQMEKEFAVPATGVLPYMRFRVKTGFAEDRWVQSAETKPGSPAVVHHIIVYIQSPGKRLYEADGTARMLTGTAPGDMPLMLPRGTALRVRKGAELIFEMHYTPNGVAAVDRSSVAMIFAKVPPEREVQINILANLSIELPPGEPHIRSEKTFTLKDDALILSFMPHMHTRGKSWRYEAIYPDGRREVLLNVPRWDFNWQSVYRFAEPVRVPKGTQIRSVALWDNSANNPNNPDPKATVRYGLQTWDEMMNGWMTYVWVRPASSSNAPTANASSGN